jgi:hypothetical protein
LLETFAEKWWLFCGAGKQTLFAAPATGHHQQAMPARKFKSRLRAISRAWPLPALFFILLSFAVTVVWLVNGISELRAGLDLGWLEPLAAILGGIGAFILAAILIFRRVDSAREDAGSYHLSRGLATGYYFNFVRPLIAALRDPDHPVHEQIKAADGHKIAGLVVGIPESITDFDPGRHNTLLESLSTGSAGSFTLQELKIDIAGRPRPVFAKVALSKQGKSAIIVDIPTTLSVVAEFAEFVAQREAEAAASDDDFVTEARKEIVADSEAGRFRDVLEEFLEVAGKVGSQEPRKVSPASLLHIVALGRLRKRVDELAGH